MNPPGPAELGRGVVLNAGQAVPTAWSGQPVILIDEAVLGAPAAAVGALRAAWSARLPVVIELDVDPARWRSPPSIVVEPWTVAPDLRLWDEELQFLVWSNCYDARVEGEPVWWWGRKARRIGAGPVPSGSPGDVVVDGIGAAWIDGGPRQPFGDLFGGLPVVHRESVERGRLTPAPLAADPASELAPDQQRAVGHRAGPARIIAPAGSGKTRVLTERLRHVVVDRGWERDAILAVAYNKKAQEELDARCVDFRPSTRTLNSLGLWVLGQAQGRLPSVLPERDIRRLVDGLAPSRRHRANTDPIGPYLEALSRVRLALVDPEEVEAERDDVPGLAAVFDGLRAEFASNGTVDFDEQIYAAIEVLLADGELRARLQATCRHLLVDEFQDLTPAHVLLLRLLAGPGADVFGVGDDDQVIYGHAGADPAFLIGYSDLFPGAVDHPLEVNYRCPPAVVDAASALLSYNHRRVAKIIRSGRREAARAGSARAAPVGDPSGDGPEVAHAEVADAEVADADETGLAVVLHGAGGGAALAVAMVRTWLAGGAGPEDIAVLARVHSALLAPAVALAAAGIPVASTLRADILERTGLRAALAYLRIATAPEWAIAAADVIEVHRRPSRGLPPWFADRVRRRSHWGTDALAAIAANVADKDAPKVERLVDDVVAIRIAASAPAVTAAGLLAVVRDEIGLGGAMGLLDASRGGEGSSHLDDLDALAEVAALHPDPETLERWLREQLARPAEPDGLTLSTVHRVKGLEWDRVLVYGVTAGLLPHRLAEDGEEERRILHVAVTRARRSAVVLGDRDRLSPLLAEMDGSAPHRPAGGPAAVAAVGSRRAGGGSAVPQRNGAGSPGGTGAVRRVEARVGLRVVVSGGFSGTVDVTDAEGTMVTLETGAGLRVRPGETVSIRGRDVVLVPPADLPTDVAAAETALRAWRTGRARKDKVSAFIVCSDRTLRAIATGRPRSLAALRQVDGIGPTKLELYGEEILGVLSGVDDPAGSEQRRGGG